MDRMLARETARATVDAATRAVAATQTTFMGGTVTGSGSGSGNPTTVGYGSYVSVHLDGDPIGVNTAIVNATATALPVGARVIVADANTGTFVVGCNNQAGGRYLISGQRLTAAASSFALVGIPQCFQYLELVCTLRQDQAAGADALLRVNGLATNIYTGEELNFLAGAGVVGSGEHSAQSSFSWFCWCPGANETTGYFGQSILRCLNYTSPTAWPTFMGEAAFWSADAGVFNGIRQVSCTPGSTATPITRIDITPNAGNFISGSTVELYGLGVAL